jgi:hypothetical protein
MLTRIILILVASSFFVGCSNLTFPKPPDVKDHYYLDLLCKRDANKKCVEVIEVACFKYKILSLNPYKIGERKEVPLGNCETLGGYLADDIVKILNYQSDVNKWIEDNKQCFK